MMTNNFKNDKELVGSEEHVKFLLNIIIFNSFLPEVGFHILKLKNNYTNKSKI